MRIHSWSHKLLSFGGRLALIKSTLGAIPLHVFQVLEPTKEATKQMESLFAKYFWGSTQEKRATHWISWEQMCHPFEEGGLGIRRLEEMVEAFGMKLWVRFREQNSLWAKFMLQKYCRRAAPSKANYSGNQSITWKRIARAGSKIHNHILWALGDGNIHFWEDIWWGDRPLSEMCNPRSRLPYRLVKDFWVNGEWNVPLLRGVLVPLGVPGEVIDEVRRIPIEYGGKDTLRWGHSAHGNFTTTSAWELCRHRHPHTPVFNLIWNGGILPSISIFVWRLLANRIPVDTKLQWRKISLASKCRCCKSPNIETREHLFLQGEVAAGVWEKASDWFLKMPRWNVGVTNFEARIRFWHRRIGRTNNSHASMIIPCLVLWFIWSERNGNIHRGTLFNADTVFNRIKMYLQQLITAGRMGKKEWDGCDNLEGFNTASWKTRARKLIKLVRWIPPDIGWIKINTKGVWRQSEAGAGGIIRDSRSNIIRGFMTRVSASSALEADLHAISLGLEIASGRGQRIWIELDSVGVASMLQANKQGPANLRHCITHIRNMMKQVEVKVSHCSSVSNKAADLLAQQGCKEAAQQEFDHNTAPTMIKALLRMDQLNIPNFQFHES